MNEKSVFFKDRGDRIRNHDVLEISTYTDKNTEQFTIMTVEQEDIVMHGHDCFELTYVIDGSAKHTLNGEMGILKAGDYFVVDYGSQHCYEDCRDFTVMNCLFQPGFIDNTLTECLSFEEVLHACLIRYYKKYYGQKLSNHILHDEDKRVLSILLEMDREYKAKEIGYVEFCRCHLLEIMILIMRRFLQESSSFSESMQENFIILELIRYLELHYREKSVLKQFCREQHFSLPYISSRFKRETGMTVMEYLQKIRMEKSCQMLLGSDLTVQEIANAVGYGDVKFFNQVFLKYLKMTPRAYRKMGLNN